MKEHIYRRSSRLSAVSCQLSAGSFVLLVLVFSAVFLTLLSALTGYLFVQQRAEQAKQNRERAINIAEAGLEYYRWYLAHFPDDLQNGTGSPGPYEHAFEDPETGEIGTFSLDIDGNYQCGSPTTISIESTGWSANDPSYRRTLFARYARPSVAEYSYIINSNVWAGSDRVITGRYHSNGGIRMDGTSNSTVSSGVSSWLCTSSFGCSPSQTVNGVFGSGSPQELWSYPAPPVDFAGITVDLSTLEDFARNEGGLFFNSVGGESNHRGYHAVFNANGTVTVYRVTGVTTVWGYTTEYGWQQERPVIATETLLGTYDIPDTCSVIFFNDRLWLEGTVSGKVTVASAAISQPNYDTDIYLPNNITYANGNGVDGLTAIAERNVYIGLNTPDVMTLNGIFIAQAGRFGRNHYCQNDCSSTGGNQGLPSALDPYVYRSSLSVNGTIVSNGREGSKWTSGGSWASGYNQRTNSYDRALAVDPPPFTPNTSSDYEFVEWREESL